MNRHERRRAASLGNAATDYTQKDYEKEVQRVFDFIQVWAQMGRHPTFAFPPDDFAIAGSLDHWGHLFARDTFAHELIDALCDMAKGFGTEPPTITMLRMVIKANNIPTLPVTFAELGIDPSQYFIIQRAPTN